jgi:hypothetical protein
MAISRAASPRDIFNPGNQFLELSNEYRAFAQEAGVELVPYQDQSLPYFGALDERAQREVLEALGVSVQICRNTKAQGNAMDDTPSLIWQALKELGLRPPSDLFGHMNDCNVVEVYSPKNIQLFRTFSFFRYCSYTLEELYCHDWVQLFPRDDVRNVEMILNFVSDVFERRVRNTVSLRHIPNHIVREARSSQRLILEVGINWGAPLFFEGGSEPAATIFLETGKLLGP